MRSDVGAGYVYIEELDEGMYARFAPAVPGHAPGFHAYGDWRCKCGIRLGPNQRAAREFMAIHRLDLWVARKYAEIEKGSQRP